jgi:hypothetical protein
MRKFGKWNTRTEYRCRHGIGSFKLFKFCVCPRLGSKIGVVYRTCPKQGLVREFVVQPQTSVSKWCWNCATVGFPNILCSHLRSLRAREKGNGSVSNTGKISPALAYIRRASPIDHDGSRTLLHCIDADSSLQLRLVEALSGRRPTARERGSEAPYTSTTFLVEMLSRILLLIDI